jgi:hypothetical protein
MNQVKQTAGRLGGKTTLKKYGVEHFRKIGAKGAKVFHLRYRLEPVRMNDFAIVHRVTGEVKGFINGY